ncbi:AIG2-like protein D isoform X2 [Rutidosis leptorrhynchoides]|uniref:AIG2-like protein D isoform X2 n=1 Tax=Rutidosis leptorrhynchoides TaxID=125765 RepID=UPI003A9A3FFF
MAMTSANSGAVAVGGGGAVFVYGSLLADNVVQLLLNRVPQTSPAILNDYHRFSIKGRVYPAIRPVENKQVTGRVLIGLSATELDILDDYEAEEYDKRVVNVSLLIWDGNFPKFQSVRPYWNESDLQFCWSIWLADFKAASLGAGQFFFCFLLNLNRILLRSYKLIHMFGATVLILIYMVNGILRISKSRS